MEQLMIFSEANIYILSKLVALVRRDTGVRHRLNSNDSIMDLLRGTSKCDDERIKSYFSRFLENLTPEQLVSFKESGLEIPIAFMRQPGLFPTPISRQYAHMPR